MSFAFTLYEFFVLGFFMANLSQGLSHHDISFLHSLSFPGQSLQFAEHFPLSYLNLENQKLLPEFGECTDKTSSNLSIYDPYSPKNSHTSIGSMNLSIKQKLCQEENTNCALSFNAGPDFGQCMYSDKDNRIGQEEYLDSMAFNQGSDLLASSRFTTSESRIVVDSCCVETASSSYSAVCREVEDVSRRADQFQLFSELDDGAYSLESFGLHESPNSYNKRPYVSSEITELPLAKKHCSSNSPRKPKLKLSPSKDPQSIAAKNRRERISERLKILQDLVPNGTKVDLVTMLEKAISYVKFLQLQVKVLASDEFWPSQGGKAPQIDQVKEAIDAILSSHKAAGI